MPAPDPHVAASHSECIKPATLPAATTTFRYFNPAVVIRIRVGDAIVFRADRYVGSLWLMVVPPAPSGAAR